MAASLCLALLGGALPLAAAPGVSPEAANAEQRDNARSSFTTALEAYDSERYEEALDDFRRSYAAVASPNTHLMIARTLRSLGRIAEAYEELGLVVDEAEAAAKADDKYDKAADAARADRQALETEIGRLRVRGSESLGERAQLSVGGRTIPRERWDEPVVVEPGTVVVHVLGQHPKEIGVSAGSTVEVDVTPPRVPFRDDTPVESEVGYTGPDRRTMAYVAGGVGAVGLITYAIFGALTLTTYDDIDEQCRDKQCPLDLSEDSDRGRIYQGVANAGFVVGVIGIATGAGLLAWDLLDDDDDSDAALSVGPGAVSAKVAF
jgi:tetratricopeptide (TPR) repeat protein